MHMRLHEHISLTARMCISTHWVCICTTFPHQPPPPSVRACVYHIGPQI